MRIIHETAIAPTPGTKFYRQLADTLAALRLGLNRHKDEWKWLAIIIGIFLLIFYMPLGTSRFDNAVMESLYLAQEYARDHVLLCLVPAFFIAGGIAVFISQASVMKYLGANAPKV